MGRRFTIGHRSLTDYFSMFFGRGNRNSFYFDTQGKNKTSSDTVVNLGEEIHKKRKKRKSTRRTLIEGLFNNYEHEFSTQYHTKVSSGLNSFLVWLKQIYT